MKRGIIIGIIVGGIIFGSIGVLAGSYNAKQVSFTPNDESWNVNNVEDAMNDLKTKYHMLDTQTTASSSDILAGKTAYDSNGNLINGTYSLNKVGNSSVLSSGSTIDVSEGDIIFVVSVYSITATNAIDISGDFTGGQLSNVNGWAHIFKATGTKVTIRVRDNYSFGYIVLR